MRAISAPHRTARVRPTLARPSFTTADARRLGIRARLSSFTARLPHGSNGARLSALVSQLDGTVIRPGDALSLRGLLGSRTPSGARGSALATAVFNAAWLGGLRVTAHAAGASYTGAAPVGRDASLRDGQDVAFTDDTRFGVLVSSSVQDGSLTVTLWSTRRWTVTSGHGSPTHVVRAARHVIRGKQCTPRKGRDGFDVTVTRTFAHGGNIDHQSAYTVSYAPVAAVVCKGKRHHH
jgi:vancomycin resistance protein YoaR